MGTEEAPDPESLSPDAIDSFVQKFQAELPKLEAFRTTMQALLQSLLAQEEIQYNHFESRCKGVEQYREKITRKAYTDPDRQMTDRIGLRAILFYDFDVDRVVELVRKEFQVDEVNSEDKRSPTNAESFGYRSYHLVFTLDDKRSSLPEWKNFSNVPVELQVRTVLAHAWAAVDHQLDYKAAPGLSNEGKRLLARVSAMLETADELFGRLRDVQLEHRVSMEILTESSPAPPTLDWP